MPAPIRFTRPCVTFPPRLQGGELKIKHNASLAKFIHDGCKDVRALVDELAAVFKCAALCRLGWAAHAHVVPVLRALGPLKLEKKVKSWKIWTCPAPYTMKQCFFTT